MTNITVDRGEGSWLVTTDGERYLDYSSGIGVTNTGHAHPRVVAAVQAQAAKLLHGQQNIVYHEAGLRLYDRLRTLLPGRALAGASSRTRAPRRSRRPSSWPGRPRSARSSSSSAAATTAARPRRWPSRRPRTSTAADFEPLPGSVYSTAYPYCYRAPGGAHAPDAGCTCDWEAQLDLTLHTLTYPEHVAAIIVEPVLGEGGYIVPPPGFLPRLREITRAHGILLVADEVQTGMGRTGELFAVRHWDVEPDILVFAKGIASGLPLSGIIARPGAARRVAAGRPRRHLRRQRRRLRGGERDARRHRGRGAGRQRPRARRPAPGGAPADPGAARRRRRRPRPRLHGGHGVRRGPARATGGSRTRTSRSA